MKSMTGYGRGEFCQNERKFIVEIKSVNHRYGDINIKLPRNMICYEDAIKKEISKKVFRGKIDVYLTFEKNFEEDVKVIFNEVLASNYVNIINCISEKFDIESGITAAFVSKLPDVVTVESETEVKGENDFIWAGIYSALSDAVSEFIEMREAEGENLKNNISDKVEYILRLAEKIKQKAPEETKNYKEKLTKKFCELKEFGFDESRIVTEVAIFSEKICIDEEIIRLFSHISQMKNIIVENVPIGRKLDFLVQEMNREVNTISSKSGDLEIKNITVELKSEIEKIREQIQNIE